MIYTEAPLGREEGLVGPRIGCLNEWFEMHSDGWTRETYQGSALIKSYLVHEDETRSTLYLYAGSERVWVEGRDWVRATSTHEHALIVHCIKYGV